MLIHFRSLLILLTSLSLFGCGGESNSEPDHPADAGNKTPETEITTPQKDSISDRDHKEPTQHAPVEINHLPPISQTQPQVEEAQPDNTLDPAPNNKLSPEPATDHSISQSTPELTSRRPDDNIEPEDNTPTIVVDDKSHIPGRQTILTGQMVQEGAQVYTATWQQQGRMLGEPCELSGNKSYCSLNLADPNLYIELKQPVDFCLQNGLCDHFQPASVKFTGELNYQGQVKVELTGFSNHLETAWYVDDHSEINVFFGFDYPFSNGDDPLSITLENDTDGPHRFIHNYLYFCVTDIGNDWEQQCFNVGEQAPKIEGFDHLLDNRENSDKILVGGALYNNRVTTRSIGPIPYFTGKTRNGSFKLYRPLTPEELYQMGVKLNMAVMYLKDRDYPEMNYDNKHQVKMESNFMTVNNAEQLCGQFGAYVSSIDMLMNKYGEYFDFKAAGWPSALYWSRTRNSTKGASDYYWMYVPHLNIKSDYFDDYLGITTCAREE